MRLATILKEVNREILFVDLCQALQPIQPFDEGLKMRISHLNNLCFLFLESVGATR